MKRSTIDEVIHEAKRFLKTTEAAKKYMTEQDWRYAEFSGNKYTGAIRRSSMDLTRKLADLRLGR